MIDIRIQGGKIRVAGSFDLGYMGRHETGQREPGLSVLCAFAKFYNVTLDQLAGLEPLPF